MWNVLTYPVKKTKEEKSWFCRPTAQYFVFQDVALCRFLCGYSVRWFKLEVGWAFIKICVAWFCYLPTFCIFTIFLFGCCCDVLLRRHLASHSSWCICFLLFECVLSVISFIIKLIIKPKQSLVFQSFHRKLPPTLCWTMSNSAWGAHANATTLSLSLTVKIIVKRGIEPKRF